MTAKPLEHFHVDRVATPIGTALLVTDQEGVLRCLDWEDHEDRMRVLLRRHYGPLTLSDGPAPATIRLPLERYFAGELAALAEIPWRTKGTEFQRSVWNALTRIPVGETLSYGRLAAHLGKPDAMRAVGLANGANPVGVVVPCHRVIGADGSLTGYGGGLHRKRWLLAHEGAIKSAELAL
ncbi:methylated-DNA-[protein]-cysteine S-methyltransferase [Rhizobiales bacterium GAS191]|nr:methylated-DNA-[protein]-cysteine S-methyltransferase [Rhizobiales bacterium GAS113]SEE96317.1 methylated-DNA-[protein]-cysteine S-methyltransferase [Rhizobiales bacterium GAS191]